MQSSLASSQLFTIVDDHLHMSFEVVFLESVIDLLPCELFDASVCLLTAGCGCGRSFCRVKGDPSPKEAEQLVVAAMKHGCQPNAATYHHLTDIGMRHEMMSCPSDEPDDCHRDPFVTP